MAVHIILFRGVGGATQLPTAPLRAALTDAGFENVATYINSGNAVVKTRLGREKVIATIAQICREKFGFEKAIYAPTLEEWQQVIDRNPFASAMTEGRFLHAALLESEPKQTNIDALKAMAINGDGFEVVDGIAYIHTPGGLSNSKLGMKFDKGIGVPNTARNWNSVLKLAELGRKAKG